MMTGGGLNVYVPPDCVGSVIGAAANGDFAGYDLDAAAARNTSLCGRGDDAWSSGLVTKVDIGGSAVGEAVDCTTTRGDGMVDGTRPGVRGEKSRGRCVRVNAPS